MKYIYYLLAVPCGVQVLRNIVVERNTRKLQRRCSAIGDKNRGHDTKFCIKKRIYIIKNLKNNS